MNSKSFSFDDMAKKMFEYQNMVIRLQEELCDARKEISTLKQSTRWEVKLASRELSQKHTFLN